MRQREDTLRRRIHRLSDAGVIQAATVLAAEEEEMENAMGSSGPYCLSASANDNKNMYGPDPIKNNGMCATAAAAVTTSDREEASGSEDAEDMTDDELYMMRVMPQPGSQTLPQGFQSHQHRQSQRKVGSLKSALRKPNMKSNESLFQSLPDRSELHRHSKSIPNFNQHHLTTMQHFDNKNCGGYVTDGGGGNRYSGNAQTIHQLDSLELIRRRACGRASFLLRDAESKSAYN